MLGKCPDMASRGFDNELLASIFPILNGVSGDEAAYLEEVDGSRCWRVVEVEEAEGTKSRRERGVARKHTYGELQGSDSECLQESI